jgi:hypothetical protein
MGLLSSLGMEMAMLGHASSFMVSKKSLNSPDLRRHAPYDHPDFTANALGKVCPEIPRNRLAGSPRVSSLPKLRSERVECTARRRSSLSV